MAADTKQVNTRGTSIHTGDKVSLITLSETNQLKPSSGKIGQVIISEVGTTWVIDIYDDAAANNRLLWKWLSADGNGVHALQLPMANGIRVVTSGGAPGRAVIVWE
jgi:hypothetical protein